MITRDWVPSHDLEKDLKEKELHLPWLLMHGKKYPSLTPFLREDYERTEKDIVQLKEEIIKEQQIEKDLFELEANFAIGMLVINSEEQHGKIVGRNDYTGMYKYMVNLRNKNGTLGKRYKKLSLDWVSNESERHLYNKVDAK